MTISRPDPSEYAPFYAGYISKVPDSGPATELEGQIQKLEELRTMSDLDADYAYADDKWSVKEVIGHCADAERVFAYRLLRIARGDKTPLAGFDENAWAESAPHDSRPMHKVVDEMIAVRGATLALIDSLESQMLENTGVANNNPVSARAICWILAGHSRHHLDILHDRYGI